MRILVVDDEQLLVKGIKFNLENEGWQVDACYDGAAAVEAAKNTRYNLIILDLMMPVMDGLEACMHIRQSDPAVPIIMLTAKSEDTDKLLGFEYGADDYITKPFNILVLKTCGAFAASRTRFHNQMFSPGAICSQNKIPYFSKALS